MRAFAALLGLLLVGAALAAPVQAYPSPTRILIIGDSVTQGQVGDTTWRFDLWKTLEAKGAGVDFVGPRTGLYGGGTDYDAPGYADPNFDQDHAARWGQQMTFPDYTTTDLVSTYAPDVVIQDLGINDLTWLGESPAVLIGLMEQFVSDARAARPGVTVILGQLTQHWFAGVDEYNALLDDLATRLDEPHQRVVVALAPSDYVEYVDTKDPAHPNASGEVKIAAQFADALRQVGIGVPQPPPAPPDPAPAPAGAGHLRGKALGHHRVRLAWSAPPGAISSTIDVRRAGHPWRTLRTVHGSTGRVLVHLSARQRYSFRVRPAGSDAPSNVVHVRLR